MLVSHNYKLLYCQIPKVGCTNWMNLIAEMDGIVNSSISNRIHNTPLETIYNMEPTERDYSFKNYVKVLVVRDPLTRILSCYRDKFSPHSDRKQPIFINLIEKLKSSGFLSKTAGDFPSFNEFVKLLVAGTLDEFSDFYIEPRHWLPQSDLCLPCSIKYDYILTIESLADELPLLFKEIGLPSRFNFPDRNPESIFRKVGKGQNYIQGYNYFTTQFSKLNKTDIHNLLNYYKDDFNLFGYEPFINT